MVIHEIIGKLTFLDLILPTYHSTLDGSKKYKRSQWGDSNTIHHHKIATVHHFQHFEVQWRYRSYKATRVQWEASNDHPTSRINAYHWEWSIIFWSSAGNWPRWAVAPKLRLLIFSKDSSGYDYYPTIYCSLLSEIEWNANTKKEEAKEIKKERKCITQRKMYNSIWLT